MYIILFQSVSVILMVQQTWNVGKSMAVAHANWDSQEQNVINANRILLVTNVIHVVLASLIIHCVKVYLSSSVLITPFSFTFQIAFRAEHLYNLKYVSIFAGRTKVLVATGYVSGLERNTEIIDLEDASFKCTLSQFPASVYGATGGLVGNTALICGGGIDTLTGWQYQNSCYSLKEDGDWKFETNLNEARAYAANGDVIWNNKLVIAGGYNLSTIEVATPNAKSETLPINLPIGIDRSCMVPWDTNTFMIIGGYGYDGDPRGQTHFIDMANNRWTYGPSLLVPRYNFACHTMSVHDEDYIIVAGGYAYGEMIFSTEYLSKVNYESGWKLVKNSIDSILGVQLPVRMQRQEIVASKGNKFLYTIGNFYSHLDFYNNPLDKKIYKLECINSITNCSWTKISTKLQYGRHSTVAMSIPNALSDKLCN